VVQAGTAQLGEEGGRRGSASKPALESCDEQSTRIASARRVTAALHPPLCLQLTNLQDVGQHVGLHVREEAQRLRGHLHRPSARGRKVALRRRSREWQCWWFFLRWVQCKVLLSEGGAALAQTTT